MWIFVCGYIYDRDVSCMHVYGLCVLHVCVCACVCTCVCTNVYGRACRYVHVCVRVHTRIDVYSRQVERMHTKVRNREGQINFNFFVRLHSTSLSLCLCFSFSHDTTLHADGSLHSLYWIEIFFHMYTYIF